MLSMMPPVPPLDDRSQLIRENMPLVELVVQRMVPQVPSFMTKEDMTSAAMVGLIDAANKFDPSKGVKFNTFAEYRVRGALFDEIEDVAGCPLRYERLPRRDLALLKPTGELRPLDLGQ